MIKKFILIRIILLMVFFLYNLKHFIFKTITTFGPLTCSIITTTRKFFTILGSVIIFKHPLNPIQWLGVIAVFAGLLIDHKYGKEIKKKA